jgi:hypothetical protein
MKTRYGVLLLMLLFVISTGYSQDKEKKSKQEKKLEKQKMVEELMNSKTFLFEGYMAYSEKGKSVNISSGANSVSFTPDLIKSDLPFFGEARTASAGYGSPGGLKFEGKPDEFTVDSTKKGYNVKANVKTGNESYKLNLSVGTDGNATLYVYSVNRSSMRFSGDIIKMEESK